MNALILGFSFSRTESYCRSSLMVWIGDGQSQSYLERAGAVS